MELSRAILGLLQRSNQATDVFECHLGLEQAVSDGPPLAGNHVRLLHDSLETDRAMFAAIPGVLAVKAA